MIICPSNGPVTAARWAEGDERATEIILADLGRYAGLPVAWARLWVQCNGLGRRPVERASIVAEKQKTRESALF